MFATTLTHSMPIKPLLVLAILTGIPATATGQTVKTTPVSPSQAPIGLSYGYSVKQSDITVPSDVPIGQYRRVTRPFPNWTLICDENLEKMQKVCNISQTILNHDGNTVFSWSLAAAQDGQPFLILRTPPTVGPGNSIQLDLRDGASVVAVPISGCDPTVCIAYQSVGPRLRAAVEKGGTVDVRYVTGSPPNTVSFQAPFDGLNAALSGI